MSETLKEQALNGVIWSSIDRFSMQGIQFILSIIIARQLVPSDYGIIAMLAIFLALAQAFIDSGFSNALIQKQNRTDIDYSTVFFFNIGVGIIMYGLLVLCAPAISSFYDMPLLNDIIKWVGLNLIVTSFATVQRAKLTIELDFKRQAVISIVSTLLGGGVSVWMAYRGYGVWTLVASVLVGNFITTVLLWWSARWIPRFAFSIDSFKELFGFGSKLLAGGLIHIIYKNLYTLIIGKMFPVSQLGAYNKAYTITQYPSSNLTGVLTRVTYPIECKAQSDNEKLYSIFARIICFSNPLFIIIGFLHKFIHLGNKHVKVDVFPLVPDFSILTNQTDFKQVRTFIQDYLNFSGVLESVDLEFNTTLYHFHRLNLNSPGHKDREIGFQDWSDIPGQF